MKYKNGIVFWGKVYYGDTFHLVELKPVIQDAAKKMDQISREETNNEIVLTSVIEGKHSDSSLHPKGLAIDVRTWIYTNAEKEVLKRRWNKKLNPAWDYDKRKGQRNFIIIHEGIGTKNEHIHIGYRPETIK